MPCTNGGVAPPSNGPIAAPPAGDGGATLKTDTLAKDEMDISTGGVAGTKSRQRVTFSRNSPHVFPIES